MTTVTFHTYGTTSPTCAGEGKLKIQLIACTCWRRVWA